MREKSKTFTRLRMLLTIGFRVRMAEGSKGRRVAPCIFPTSHQTQMSIWWGTRSSRAGRSEQQQQNSNSNSSKKQQKLQLQQIVAKQEQQ